MRTFLVALLLALCGTVRAETVYFIHVDHLNTPRLAVSEDGPVHWRWEQIEPFGENVALEVLGTEGYLINLPLRFPGQYLDKETNLHYNMARDYASDTGRYIQSDPIGLAGGINTYAYVEGNPIARTDPTGKIPAPTGLATGASTSTGTSTASGSGAESGSGGGGSTQICFAENCYLKVQIRSPLLTSCTYYCTFSGREFTLFLPGFRICSESVNR